MTFLAGLLEQLRRQGVSPEASEAARHDLELLICTGGIDEDVELNAAIELRHDGKALADVDRKALLERSLAGEHIEIEFDARTFLQGEKPNRKFVRVKPSSLGRLARSGVRAPFLKDHNKLELDARGGTILKSELVQTSSSAELHQTIRLVKPWAVQGVLDGTLDRFSIGMHPTGEITCSVHKAPIFTKCFCLPGDRVGDTGERVEFIIESADNVETSAVNVPAVVGTGIKGIRAALSALAADAGGMVPPPPQEEKPVMKRLLVLLGLSEAASEDAAVAALEVKLAELKTAREATGGIAAMQAELEVLRASQIDHHIERLCAEGKLPVKRDEKGSRVPGELETKLRNLAGVVGMKAMLEVGEALPVIAPVGPRSLAAALGADQVAGGQIGAHPQSGGGQIAAALSIDPANAVQAYASGNNISPEVLAVAMEQAGVTPKMLAESGPRRRKGG